MTLNGADRRRLRALAQPKKAAVKVGKNGVQEGVLREIDAALARDELIKIYWKSASRADQEALAEEARAHLVGQVGGSVILYRKDPVVPRVEP